MNTTKPGAKVHKHYDYPQTPLRRVLNSGLLDAAQQQVLLARMTAVGPLTLHRQINAAEELLWRYRRPAGNALDGLELAG